MTEISNSAEKRESRRGYIVGWAIAILAFVAIFSWRYWGSM
jgi:hypothetical protein